MPGLPDIHARIAQIQGQIAALRPTAPPPAAGTNTTFSNLLAKEQTKAQTQTQTQAQTSAQTNTQTQTAYTSATKGVTKTGAPADLAAYGNGKIPPAALASIGVGQHRLWAPAAHSFTEMTAAAKRDGVKIGVTDSYRSYDQQVDLAKRKGLYSQGGLAAKPGTSDHGWGRSLDLDLSPKALAWMRDHAGQYGFKENVPREPWHWTYGTEKA